MRTVDCLVVGAGMAGLTAARELHRAGRDVVVLDKGRGVGGRLATRRWNDIAFDHGAQFITVRSPAFRAMMEEWLAAGVAVEWARGFPEGSLLPFKPGFAPNDHARYRGVPAMTAIAKHLAVGLDVRCSRRIERIERCELPEGGPGWTIAAVDEKPEAGGAREDWMARSVLATAPAEQTLALLGDTALEALDDEALETLREIDFDPCFAVLVLLDGPSAVPTPGGVRLDGNPIVWIADNRQKGVSGEATAITIHAGAEFSRREFERDRSEVGQALIEAARPWLRSGVLGYQVHRWKYATPTVVAEERCVVASEAPPLVCAGDAFGGPRVEGAALSGLAAAEALARLLG